MDRMRNSGKVGIIDPEGGEGVRVKQEGKRQAKLLVPTSRVFNIKNAIINHIVVKPLLWIRGYSYTSTLLTEDAPIDCNIFKP